MINLELMVFVETADLDTTDALTGRVSIHEAEVSANFKTLRRIRQEIKD